MWSTVMSSAGCGILHELFTASWQAARSSAGGIASVKDEASHLYQKQLQAKRKEVEENIIHLQQKIV